jgi:hypothetical protein
MERPITVYENSLGSSTQFTKVGCKPLPSIYADFDGLKSVAANEALLRVLAQARSNGIGSVTHRGIIYLFVRDEFPATSMTITDLTPIMIPSDETATKPLERELGRLRIAYTPVFFDGYFVRLTMP